MPNHKICLDNENKIVEVIPMFERAAIFSAFLVLIGFGASGVKFLQFTGLEAEPPLAIFQEMFPPIDTTN
ncbi:conserved hypothetical protein [Hyella patelloides LEGE 07179]|uniref:Uncharacterized protein n=1 Tax=Hyella patelloides LEGE 07179 TaxID=945734 RepID=A0A563W1F2_9CYAN|nr:hypothetical protein [Hyella patelloides]VEP17486.1 conserved hypothetical protein [Hyella patelloides LEGE 07179]